MTPRVAGRLTCCQVVLHQELQLPDWTVPGILDDKGRNSILIRSPIARLRGPGNSGALVFHRKTRDTARPPSHRNITRFRKQLSKNSEFFQPDQREFLVESTVLRALPTLPRISVVRSALAHLRIPIHEAKDRPNGCRHLLRHGADRCISSSPRLIRACCSRMENSFIPAALRATSPLSSRSRKHGRRSLPRNWLTRSCCRISARSSSSRAMKTRFTRKLSTPSPRSCGQISRRCRCSIPNAGPKATAPPASADLARRARKWEWVRFDTDSTCGQALRTGKRAIAGTSRPCDFLAARRHGRLLDAGIRAAQSTPLFSRSGKMLGMISSHWRKPHIHGARPAAAGHPGAAGGRPHRAQAGRGGVARKPTPFA